MKFVKTITKLIYYPYCSQQITNISKSYLKPLIINQNSKFVCKQFNMSMLLSHPYIDKANKNPQINTKCLTLQFAFSEKVQTQGAVLEHIQQTVGNKKSFRLDYNQMSQLLGIGEANPFIYIVRDKQQIYQIKYTQKERVQFRLLSSSHKGWKRTLAGLLHFYEFQMMQRLIAESVLRLPRSEFTPQVKKMSKNSQQYKQQQIYEVYQLQSIDWKDIKSSLMQQRS